MKKKVRIIHLISGVELIAEEIEQSNDDVISVKSPYCIYVVADSLSNNQSIKVSPWSIATWKANPDKVYYFNRNLVFMVSDAPAEIESMYIQNTTGLSIPSERDKQLICG